MENLVYGYASPETMKRMGMNHLNEINILVGENSFNYNFVRKKINDVIRLMEMNGYEITGVEIPKPGKHPHASQFSTLYFYYFNCY